MTETGDRLRSVRARVDASAVRADRDPATVKLIAVSKEKPAEQIREAYAEGQREFGESYAQELRAKADSLKELGDLRWHFIGHLQTNKAKFVAPVACLVETIDSPELVAALVRRAEGRAVPCLLEVNIGAEAQKHGLRPESVEAVAKTVAATPGAQLRGLMCVPPAEQPARPFFKALHALRDRLQESLGTALPELSMGMSHDFEDAIAEGATIVRVGTAIFGGRNSSK